MRTKKIELMEKELVELNKKFHEKQLIDARFYNQLLQQGVLYQQSILVSLFPDSGNTYCGQVIRQDGNVFEFDIDLDSVESSLWQDITASFTSHCEVNKRVKPWSVEVVATKLFKANK